MVNKHRKSWQKIQHSLCSFNETLKPHSGRKKWQFWVHTVNKVLLFWPQEAVMLKVAPPRVSYYHPLLVKQLPTSLASDSSLWKIWNILHTFKMQWIFLISCFHFAHLELDNCSHCSFQSVPPTVSAVDLEKGHSSSCDVKCNWELALGWCIFSLETPLIEVGLHTSVSINIFPISFWHSEWLVFLRTRRGLGIQGDVSGLIR